MPFSTHVLQQIDPSAIPKNPSKTWTEIPNGTLYVHRVAKHKTRMCVTTDDPRYDESPTDFDRLDDEIDGSSVLYEDKFIKVTEKTIVVKRYFFPNSLAKRIPVEKLRKIKIVHDKFIAPKWGIDFDNKTWWSYNHLRNETSETTPICNLVLNTGDFLLKGVSVKNLDDFLRAVSNFEYDLEY